MSKDSYRMDNRDQKQFKRDIKEGTRIEKEIITIWANKVHEGIEVTDNGCGNDGEYLKASKISMDADYNVEGFGLIEVKFSKPKCDKFFHLKVSQMDSCIKQKASILLVNGWNTETPEFVFLTVEDLGQIQDFCEQVRWYGFGGKLSYRIPVNLYEWEEFPRSEA